MTYSHTDQSLCLLAEASCFSWPLALPSSRLMCTAMSCHLIDVLAHTVSHLPVSPAFLPNAESFEPIWEIWLFSGLKCPKNMFNSVGTICEMFVENPFVNLNANLSSPLVTRKDFCDSGIYTFLIWFAGKGDVTGQMPSPSIISAVIDDVFIFPSRLNCSR